MANLAVRIDHVATLREIRETDYPDPLAAAVLAELAGADGIAVNLKEERSHIQDRDIQLLRSVIQSNFLLEMAPRSEMVGMALDVQPDLVTLVPEKREEFTTEGGLDLIIHKDSVAETIGTMQNSGIPVGVFIDPDPDQIKVAHQINSNVVGINTGTFCDSKAAKNREQAFSSIVDAVKLAHKLKISVHAGHGLGYKTIKDFKGLYEIDTFCIGYSIVSKAVLVGMDRAVRDMVALIKEL